MRKTRRSWQKNKIRFLSIDSPAMQSRRITAYYGQDYTVSMLFANLGDTQLRARLVARKTEFEELQRAFRGSLFSLHWQ